MRISDCRTIQDTIFNFQSKHRRFVLLIIFEMSYSLHAKQNLFDIESVVFCL